MSDLDALKRTIADLEKQFVMHVEVLAAVHSTHNDLKRRLKMVEDKLRIPPTYYGSAPKSDEQWCRCGRDVCRYPACSSKIASVDDPDPLGR